jgi:hypothetical protein
MTRRKLRRFIKQADKRPFPSHRAPPVLLLRANGACALRLRGNGPMYTIYILRERAPIGAFGEYLAPPLSLDRLHALHLRLCYRRHGRTASLPRADALSLKSFLALRQRDLAFYSY